MSFELEIWNLSNADYFWQYPVITEQQVMTSLAILRDKYLLSRPVVYLAVPWATIIDKNIYSQTNLESKVTDLIKEISELQNGQDQDQDPSTIYVTACQHIHFKRIISILKLIKVKFLFTSHKRIDQNVVNGVRLLPLQLFAVNIEDTTRNEEFQGVDFLAINRPLLYSFTGFYTKNYMTRIRKKLFVMNHPQNCQIESTNKWHFVDTVYKDQTQIYKTTRSDKVEPKLQIETYNKTLLRSRFSLCPSGSGPNSIRLWESLAIGSIPVILSDKLELPPIPDENYSWDQVVVTIPEEKVKDLAKILRKITQSQEQLLRERCLKVYKLFSDRYFSLHILKTLQSVKD